jgi:hypothetical protein
LEQKIPEVAYALFGTEIMANGSICDRRSTMSLAQRHHFLCAVEPARFCAGSLQKKWAYDE